MKAAILFILMLGFSRFIYAQDSIPPKIFVQNPLDTYKIEIGDSLASVLDSIYATDNVTSSNELLKTLSFGGTYVHTFGIGPAFECGLFTLQYAIEDEAGNKAEFVRHVLVYDHEAPMMTFDEKGYVIMEGEPWDADTIKWSVSDNAFDSADLPVRLVSDNVDTSSTGLYEVVFEIEEPCGNKGQYSISIAVDVIPHGGLDDYSEFFKIVAFPNPSKGSLNIDVSHLNSAELSMKLYNFQGKTLADYGEFQSQSVIELPNLGSFENGIYFLQISTDQSSTFKKIILSK